MGRVAELEELAMAVDSAADRRPVLALLAGDSGIGKTRLIAELERLLAGRDVLLLRGESVEQDDGELPYAPLTSALRPLVRARDAVLGELARGSRAQLASLLPGLDELDEPRNPNDPSAQLRLFEALLELLDLLSERQPVVLIFEDMHWSDRSTRTFVSFLARSLRRERVMLVLTYRTDELHRRHPLRPLLSELERLELVRRIQLEPFSRDELGEVLADILCAEPGDAMVERLYARSEGNPLYTEELLAAGLDGRGAAPQSLRDAFMLRIECLSAEAQQSARAIAVGRRIAERVIQEVTGIDRARLQEALREAVAEQVLITDEDGRLRFRHALLAEVLYDDLLPGERGELHLALARSLESRMGGQREQQAEFAAAVAHHYAAGGDQPAALRAAANAALSAGEVHAYAEAAELAERALELWPRVLDAEQTSPVSQIDLLALAASAHSFAGDRNRAEVLLTRALEIVDAGAHPARCAALLAQLARIQWSLNRGDEGVATAQEALSLLPADEPSRERAILMAWLARTRVLRGKFRDAVTDGEPALAAAVEATDRHAEGEVLNTLGMAQIALGNVDPGVGLLLRAIEMARADGDLDNLGYAYANLADMLGLAGRTGEALETAHQGLGAVSPRLVRQHDWMMLTVAQLAFEAGDWETARAHLRTDDGRPDAMSIYRSLVEAEVALADDDGERVQARLDEAKSFVGLSGEPQFVGWFGALEAELLRRRHDLLGARSAVEDALGRLEVCTDDVMRIARVSAVGALTEADIARRARDLRERGEEREALARLRIHNSRLDAAAQTGGPVERAWQAVGRAQLARARGRNDPALWRRAAERWEVIGRPYPAAIMHFREAEAGVEADDRTAAERALQAALEVAGRLGASWLRSEAEALAHRARLALKDGAGDAAVRAAPVPDGQPEDPFGLTARERQVLALIAEGATNRQIGAALFMAEKTASVHVSRILGKLGVKSRTQAAAVAHRLRLT